MHYYNVLPLQPLKQNFGIWLGKSIWLGEKGSESQHQRSVLPFSSKIHFLNVSKKPSGPEAGDFLHVAALVQQCICDTLCSPKVSGMCWGVCGYPRTQTAALAMEGNIFYSRTTLWKANSKGATSPSVDIYLCWGQWQSHLDSEMRTKPVLFSNFSLVYLCRTLFKV